MQRVAWVAQVKREASMGSNFKSIKNMVEKDKVKFVRMDEFLKLKADVELLRKQLAETDFNLNSKTARYQLYFPSEHLNFLDALKILVASIMKAKLHGGILNLNSSAYVWKVEPENGYSAIRIEFEAKDIVGFKRIVKRLLASDPHPLIKTIQPTGTTLYRKEVTEEPDWSGDLIKMGHWYIKELALNDVKTQLNKSFNSETDTSNELEKLD